MCGCNQTPMMADGTQTSQATQEQLAKLGIGTGIALLVGLGAGAAFIISRKPGRKGTKRK